METKQTIEEMTKKMLEKHLISAYESIINNFNIGIFASREELCNDFIDNFFSMLGVAITTVADLACCGNKDKKIKLIKIVFEAICTFTEERKEEKK
ncbi:MAG: hypothetical protein NC083_09070 [Muribaculum sp.]|nr:hypothetical protein [Muribaculum sp.]MCM1577097.1 hypothetical protein [Bacteroides sp.]